MCVHARVCECVCEYVCVCVRTSVCATTTSFVPKPIFLGLGIKLILTLATFSCPYHLMGLGNTIVLGLGGLGRLLVTHLIRRPMYDMGPRNKIIQLTLSS